jgi:cAMP phosphodiesterase
MSCIKKWVWVTVLMIHTHFLLAQHTFTIVPLGVKGGSDETNLSSYLVAPKGKQNFLCLDAGTLYGGLQKAVANKQVTGPTAVDVLKNNIKGYFISHGHLDHVSGLIINSPEDTAKPIYALPEVIKVLREKYFTWDSWANFTNEGDFPLLKKYTYKRLDTISEIEIDGTGLFLKAFELSHVNPQKSTAALIRYNLDYMLYLGDTGADAVEHSDKLFQLWKSIAPLIDGNRLKAIMIEVSFPDSQPDKLLFGHLTPRLLMQELTALAAMCKKKNALKDLPVIITHMKPKANHEQIIKKELQQQNKQGVKLIFPQQGKALHL